MAKKLNNKPASAPAEKPAPSAEKAAAVKEANALSESAHARYGAATKREKLAFIAVQSNGDVLERMAWADALDECRAAREGLAEADAAITAANAMQ